jgi:hypothetical protein
MSSGRLIAVAFAAAVALLSCTVDGPVVPSPTPTPPPPADAGLPRTPNRPDAGGGTVDASPHTCGDVGIECCVDGPPCLLDFTFCDTGVCQPCGDLGQACCPTGIPCRGAAVCDLGLCSP